MAKLEYKVSIFKIVESQSQIWQKIQSSIGFNLPSISLQSHISNSIQIQIFSIKVIHFVYLAHLHIRPLLFYKQQIQISMQNSQIVIGSQTQQQDNREFYHIQWTGYPYTRYQCAQLFKAQHQQDEELLDIAQCDQKIQYGFNVLSKYEYFVQRTYYPPTPPHITKVRRRKVRLSFRCEPCNKSFTSIVGCFQIEFYVFRKQNYANVFFHLKMYQMECATCKALCEGKIFRSQLHAVTTGFRLVIAEIIENIKPPKHIDGRDKLRQVHNHIQELCEACKMGVCFARPKQETRIVQNTKKVQNPKKVYKQKQKQP